MLLAGFEPRRGVSGDEAVIEHGQVPCVGGGGHAHRLATQRMRSMTMAPSMLSVGSRVDDSASPLRRYTAIAGSIAPRSVSSHAVWHSRSVAPARAASISRSAMPRPRADRSHVHSLQLCASVGLDADRDGTDRDRLPGGEVERGVVGSVVAAIQASSVCNCGRSTTGSMPVQPRTHST
jgi:hypothetical protein